MQRNIIMFMGLLALHTGLSACDPYIRNCPVVGKSPSSNLYNLEYELLIPADCPIPLASPGLETKYAAARLADLGVSDFNYAIVKVKNSKGETIADDATVFLGGIAEPAEEYVAATGTKRFDDYDVGIFRAWNAAGTKAAAGETRLTYQQSSLATRLAGTRIPQVNSSQTWTAPSSGGYPAYSYRWYRDGQLVSTASSYSTTVGSSDFDLRVEVTDQTWSTRAAVLDVDVGGVAVTIRGPSEVYPSRGGSWTASGQGGTGAYSFEWYLDDVLIGTSSSWSGYPGDGRSALQVRMRDSAGAFTSLSKLVHGLPDSEEDECVPIPGARAC